MTNPLAVLVLESHDGVAAAVAEKLEAAGHHLFRCHEPGAANFPCTALAAGGTCPLDAGIDVAVTARAQSPWPTAREDGVACALRAGVPVVEVNDGTPSPFQGWTFPECADVVTSCEAAARTRFEPLERDVVRRLAPLAARKGVAADDLSCEVHKRGDALEVRVVGPAVPMALQQAFSVRVLDAVRGARLPHGEVSVGYRTVV
jgi:hypothetical protein